MIASGEHLNKENPYHLKIILTIKSEYNAPMQDSFAYKTENKTTNNRKSCDEDRDL